MDQLKGFAHTTALFYVAAVIICIAAVYYLSTAYAQQPQPHFYLVYNSMEQGGMGYVNNTFAYPIEITSIYCTMPSGKKDIFGTPNNNILAPGSNTEIMIGAYNRTDQPPTNCTVWKVTYTSFPANTTVPKSKVAVT